MSHANVGEVRQQCALMDYKEGVIIRLVGDDGTVRYYRARRCWPDGASAPAGSAFYVEATEVDYLFKSTR